MTRTRRFLTVVLVVSFTLATKVWSKQTVDSLNSMTEMVSDSINSDVKDIYDYQTIDELRKKNAELEDKVTLNQYLVYSALIVSLLSFVLLTLDFEKKFLKRKFQRQNDEGEMLDTGSDTHGKMKKLLDNKKQENRGNTKRNNNAQNEVTNNSRRTACDKCPSIPSVDVSPETNSYSEFNRQNQTFNKNGAKEKSKPNKVVKYGTFRIDDNGDLKTEQRVMTDNNSIHLFRIEYQEGSNDAIYSINEMRKSAILSDLQTFQNFTEDFVITGSPSDIRVDRVGKLKKIGKSWVVSQKLKVSFV